MHQYRAMLEEVVGVESNWSGTLRVVKPHEMEWAWGMYDPDDGSITLREDAPIKTAIHELSHSLSRGLDGYGWNPKVRVLEESTVESLARIFTMSRLSERVLYDSYQPIVERLLRIARERDMNLYDMTRTLLGFDLVGRLEFLVPGLDVDPEKSHRIWSIILEMELFDRMGL